MVSSQGLLVGGGGGGGCVSGHFKAENEKIQIKKKKLIMAHGRVS